MYNPQNTDILNKIVIKNITTLNPIHRIINKIIVY